MFGLSFGELVMLLLVAVVVLGPKELPRYLRKAGQLAGQLRRMAYDMRAKSGIDEVLRSEGIGTDIAEIRRLAIETYKAVNCEVMARVDFLMESSTGQIYVNEINTIPGFTSISMYPKMWEYAGVPYSQLLDRLIGYALDRAEAKKAIRYSR